jgi:formylglycine-generating enzyme
MNCVPWYTAKAFCAWDGGFLPTEAEWNYAAAGGDEQRAFPWSVPPESNAIDNSRGSYGCQTGVCSSIDNLLVVGSRPLGDGRWGHADLMGNVWEWTLDWRAPYVNPCVDCAQLSILTLVIIRGGSFNSAGRLRVADRGLLASRAPDDQVGVRCARPL